MVAKWLKRQGHNENAVIKALRRLENTAAREGSKTLYDAYRKVCKLSRCSEQGARLGCQV